jgi:hypothetical protein
MQRPFIERGLGGDGVVTAAIPPYYGALAGAHTAPRRRGRGALVGGKASGGGAYGGAWPQAEEGVGRRAGCGCRGPAGARRCGATAPCPIYFAEHMVEQEKLHFFE